MTTTINGFHSRENHKNTIEEESILMPDFDNARITKLAPKGKTISYLYEDTKTLVEMMERACRISENGRCMGWRATGTEYTWITYDEVLIRAKNFGSGLINLGLKLGQSTFVGLYGQNSIEWVIAQYGCLYYSSAIIPLYETLGSDALTYMINHGEIKLVVCDTESKVEKLLHKIEKSPLLKHIVCVSKVKEDLYKLAKEKGIELHLYEDVEKSGKQKPITIKPPKPSDVAIICFTSGTTGKPKGAILTHHNIIAAGSGLILQMGSVAPNKDSVMISYLPLAHIMEQTLEVLVFMTGGCFGFFRGDIRMLFEDIKALRPTFFPAVPKILNKLYTMAQDMARKNSSETEIGIAKEESKTEKNNTISNFDPHLCKKFMENLGGRVKLVLSAAAPISDEILRFYHQLGCDVVEVYGQTESAGPCTINVVSDTSTGNVGPPTPCCMIKLEDVPHLGYFKKNNTGEICVKGPNCCRGYLKDPIRTAEIIDEDGWLHTGDIGMWLPNGTLRVIDRKKHIFKLSQGEYVAPEKIENVYLQSPYIAQIFIDGDSRRPFLVAIVVPNQEILKPRNGIISKSWTMVEMCQDPVIKQLIMDDMKRMANNANLLSFEQVRRIHLHPKLFTHEEGQLTPTLKTKRDACRKYFAEEIQEMYEGCEL